MRRHSQSLRRLLHAPNKICWFRTSKNADGKSKWQFNWTVEELKPFSFKMKAVLKAINYDPVNFLFRSAFCSQIIFIFIHDQLEFCLRLWFDRRVEFLVLLHYLLKIFTYSELTLQSESIKIKSNDNTTIDATYFFFFYDRRKHIFTFTILFP